jgi:transcriptional regulator with XRE-family HTH domain
MKLKTYLTEESIGVTEFARRLGVSRQTIHRYLASRRYPNAKHLRRISEVTDGQVLPNDFFMGQ